jgi:hypothetical protein
VTLYGDLLCLDVERSAQTARMWTRISAQIVQGPPGDQVPLHAAACVTHETKEYCHLKVDQLHIIIWKSKDTPFKPELATKE